MPEESIIEMPQPLGLFATDLFVRGEEYLLAFERLIQDGKTEFPHASFFLLAHALELFLKSYLAAHGISKGKLKIRYSHDLSKAFRKCRSLAMPQVERLDLLVERLHEMNSDYDLRYPSGCALSLPTPEESLIIARAFKDAIRLGLNIAYWKAAVHFGSDTRDDRGKKVQWSD